MAEDPKESFSPMVELGSTGLKRYGGYVYEEFLRELQGSRGMAIYRQMMDNDPIIGAFLFAIEQICRQVSWRVEPASTDQVDLEAANFLQSCLNDMSHTWPDTLIEILSMLPFGWSWHEIVYKRRQGDNRDPSKRSAYDDGRVGWRKLPIRGQESLWEWVFDENGGVQAMKQRALPDNELRIIPIDKSLLFRPKIAKGNPEGRSILRNAYRPWYFKKNIETIEAIGIERDLAGLPVAHVPPEMLKENATDDVKKSLEVIKELVTNIKRDEQEGIVFPMAFNQQGHPLFKLELLTTGGRRQFDTDAIVNRYDQRILMTVLADFIMVGHGQTGSFALEESKIGLFEKAVGGWLDVIAETFNRHAIPRLFNLNTFATLKRPTIAHGPVSAPNLKDLGEYVSKLASVGVVISEEAEAHLLRVAHLPVLAEEDSGLM